MAVARSLTLLARASAVIQRTIACSVTQGLFVPAIRSITALLRTIELLMRNVQQHSFCSQAFIASQDGKAAYLSSSKGNDYVERTLLALKAISTKASCTNREAFFVSFFGST
jgi:hypothetical protein